ncbi:putative RNA methyltransferase [Aliiglaciecola lipolytica]|uniref:23S rRNA (Guanine745-N1)-methyltransferase n=1 Tax=Aliiglaciecola lipolytica E3 TaxID=1127673 RepID=K6YSE1_9ALTE|nr:methyltransferase domain-containing protein [Aliiglaciecola lipolytica]GAC14220.1 23S rRNA (guanine745-N1)-methyltransferase [Aliiglaciecola lipolytica E3]
MWCCPACGLQLQFENGTWRCESNHTFDQAKEGYVNLQLAQERNSKAPGDNKEMIVARRAFLEKGFYDPLVERLAQLIKSHCNTDNVSLFDAGCGEGYYLEQIRSKLDNTLLNCRAAGCDISKVAIQKAAKAHKKCHFAVASTFKIPVQSSSLDTVIQVFAPSSEQEIARILKPGGLWLLVNPGPAHLQQLKQSIYNESKQHSLTQLESTNFSLHVRESVGFDMAFKDSEERLNLLKMTPFYWHASEQSKNQFLQSSSVCQTEFDIQVLRKNHDS